jgi:hypothetical protein
MWSLLGLYLVFNGSFIRSLWFSQSSLRGTSFARTPRFAPLDLYLVSIGSLCGLYLVFIWSLLGLYVVFNGSFIRSLWFSQSSLRGTSFARTPRFAPLDLYLVSIGSLCGLYLVFIWSLLGLLLGLYLVFMEATFYQVDLYRVFIIWSLLGVYLIFIWSLCGLH